MILTEVILHQENQDTLGLFLTPDFIYRIGSKILEKKLNLHLPLLRLDRRPVQLPKR